MRDRPFRHVLPATFSLTALCLVLTPVWLDGARALADRVEIRRDTFGVPHILAEHEEAAAFGLGYAMAEDHAEEMGRRYLRARGEAAAAFGPDELANDFAVRRADNRRQAERAVRERGRGFRRWLRGFAAGYNTYVEGRRDRLPAWMPTIDEADLLAHGRAAAATSLHDAVPALRRKYGTGESWAGDRSGDKVATDVNPCSPLPLHGAGRKFRPDPICDDLVGSNALALAGSRTTSGSPVLLGNPHLRWSMLYWEAHVTVRDRLDFYGSTLVGMPVLRAGFNDRLGYVQTNNDPDQTDVYAVPLDAARADHYVHDGRSRRLATRRVVVDVATEAGGPPRREARDYWDTHLGPVILRTDTQTFVARSVALDSWTHFEGFYELARARRLDDFLGVMRKALLTTSNFTYADVDGQVLYLWNAHLPRRIDDGTDYSLDVPGDTSTHMWRGLHRVLDLPRLLNPPGGYVQNANNSPWWTSLSDRLDPARYPSYVERHPLSLRAQAALDLIEARERFTLDDVKALKFSTRMLVAERVLDDLLSAGRTVSGPSADLIEGLAVLERWDRRVDAASRGAVLFQRFWDRYRAEHDEPFAVTWDADAPLATPRGLAAPAAALAHLEEAVHWTRETHGRVDVAWGDVHRYRFGAIDLPADGAAGAYGVYRVMGFDGTGVDGDSRRIAGRLADQPPLVGTGDAWVLLVHFTRPVRAWSVLAYGQTTDAASPHSTDQIRLFAQHELRPVWFTESEIAANLLRRYHPGR